MGMVTRDGNNENRSNTMNALSRSDKARTKRCYDAWIETVKTPLASTTIAEVLDELCPTLKRAVADGAGGARIRNPKTGLTITLSVAKRIPGGRYKLCIVSGGKTQWIECGCDIDKIGNAIDAGHLVLVGGAV